MHTDSDQLREPSPESLAAGYEVSAVSVRGLVYFVLGLILTAALVHVGIWIVLVGFEHKDQKADRPRSGLTDPATLSQAGLGDTMAALPGPPPPRLQPSSPENPLHVPAADLQQMMRQEDQVFRKMGWAIDEQTHVQRDIPAAVIEQVIEDESRRQQAAVRPPEQR